MVSSFYLVKTKTRKTIDTCVLIVSSKGVADERTNVFDRWCGGEGCCGGGCCKIIHIYLTVSVE